MIGDDFASPNRSFDDRIKKICVAFEKALQAGERPSIASILNESDGAERSALFRELLLVEIDYRDRQGETPSRTEYLQQFQEFREQIYDTDFPPNDVDPTTNHPVQIGTVGDPEIATKSYELRSTITDQWIGRYRLIRVLGEGAFGRVYLAYDDDLQRQVAIKMPTAKRFERPEDADAYLNEARTAASLDHPNIVPVHDVGRMENGSIYVVSKLIDGQSLKECIRHRRFDCRESAQLIATIAQALDHAHEKRLIHRDVKPANILIDENTGTPFVADFGLAVRDEVYLRDSRIAGTPAYMSPEQARGEGHRLDGRSDIFSLGVVFYELLTGKKPFRGSAYNELLYQVSSVDPCPPRELDDSIPGELERICLKALSKRASDRYLTAAALADDLWFWQRGQQAEQDETKVVPKGLRSFDANDADFFLKLLPGPRDRDDLPESIRFWKTRIEERDPDNTFSVGMILGPSGCGKSSLVKAGLLPRLSNSVLTLYIESTQAETETRVLREMRKRLPQLPSNLGLAEMLGLVRRTSGKKVLLILDQFEQWLHAKGDIGDSVLVSSLRQCDGGKLQAIIMVRDDFSMAAARFMDALDIPILQGHNFATVDFFGVDHAQKVLTRFGQAFGRLPGKLTDVSDNERDFVRQAAVGLSQDGKVVSVRLSLFAEMVKDKTWHPHTLEEVGGTEGIGLNFLEESFSSRSANPQHRMHERAAREVLKALLPEIGSDIRGHMRSYTDLLEASGYTEHPEDFNLLLRILDGELRLITPTDVGGSQTTESGDASSKFYQLTHDYLVPVLREWLTRKQRETPRGRAELRLAERAAIWNMKRERQQLPLVSEYLSILFLTSRKNRSEAEQRMMRAAAKAHGSRWLAGCAIFLAIVVGFVMLRNRHIESQNLAKANALVDLLLVADVSELPNVVASLEAQSGTVAPRLAMMADDIRRPIAERLRALLPLANRPSKRATQLIELVGAADAHTTAVVCDRLAPFANNMKHELWDAAHRNTSMDSSRLRLAALLAIADSAATDWAQFAPSVVEALLNETTLELDVWIDLLHPAAPALLGNLQDRFFSTSATPAERATAARVLAHYSNAALLSELLLKTDATHFPTLLSGTSRQQDEVIKAILASIKELETSTTDEPNAKALRLRNAAMTLLRLGRPNEAAPILGASEDPTARTMFMLQTRDFGTTPAMLMDSFQECRDPAARQALLLSLEPYFARDLPPKTQQALVTMLAHVLRNNQYQSERSAAEWLLRRLNDEETIRAINREVVLARFSDAALRNHEWWVTKDGHTMLVIRRPGEFQTGSIESKSNGDDEATATWQTLPYDFAISVHEVTMEQFRRFRPDANFALDVADNPQCPANKVSFNDAIKYCEWLNDQEGIPAEERCYDPDAATEQGLAALPMEKLMRTGYRLPTEVEWEFACRAKSTTPWICGADSEYLTFFAWFNLNADRHLHPVGLLRPNPLGLFDVAGNVYEWCHTSADDQKLVLRGGMYDEAAILLRSGRRYSQSPTGYSFTGFRIARTLPANN